MITHFVSHDFKSAFETDVEFAVDFILTNAGKLVSQKLVSAGYLKDELPGDTKKILARLWNEGKINEFLFFVNVPFNQEADNFSVDHKKDLIEIAFAHGAATSLDENEEINFAETLRSIHGLACEPDEANFQPVPQKITVINLNPILLLLLALFLFATLFKN